MRGQGVRLLVFPARGLTLRCARSVFLELPLKGLDLLLPLGFEFSAFLRRRLAAPTRCPSGTETSITIARNLLRCSATMMSLSITSNSTADFGAVFPFGCFGTVP
jgi:hypothetical protein